ncbi:hypothetical protein TI39_contig342g00011 [Zymoseptoria brevis]|uniref:tRNA/rRNA methyltransferase SpoU type domain-containing protein n=1 Tax=Zymoseptoria brevis TaxID=1047168 RepID=A0A0F4GV74_9PEZI|nr:hypothetical protein TI39_contig342g00011 [Zymoseptoria brevis]
MRRVASNIPGRRCVGHIRTTWFNRRRFSMTGLRGKTASLLLDRIPEDQRPEVVRDVTSSLGPKSSNADVGFAAALLKLQPEERSRSLLLDHLQSQVENGCDLVADAPELEQEVLVRVIQSIAQSCSSGDKGSTENGVPVLDLGRQIRTNGTTNDTSVPSAAADRITNCLRFASRRLSVELAEATTHELLSSCLELVASAEKSVASSAQEALHALLAVRLPVSAEEQQMLWERIRHLSDSNDASQKTIGYSLWLRWTIGQPLANHILSQQTYWNLIVEVLRNGDSEKRKCGLQILRSSVDTASREPSLLSMVSSRSDLNTSSTESIRKQYARFCNTFETVVLGRYLNQVQLSEADLDFLSSPQSAVKPVWLYTLLSSALDQRLQESNRKFIGTWIMTANIRVDDAGSFISFFRTDFIPWVTAGYLFTSSLRREDGQLRCQHGDQLATYIAQLLQSYPELAGDIADAILDGMLARKNNNFAYSMVYQVEGLAQAWESIEGLQPQAEQLEKLAKISTGSAIPDVARDFALARCWKLCYAYKQKNAALTNNTIETSASRWERLQDMAKRLDADLSAQTNGTIASSALDPSKREINEQAALRKCADLIETLDRGVDQDEADRHNELVNDLWSDMEYLEYPKALLIALPRLVLHRALVAMASVTASSNDALAQTLVEKTQALLEQAGRRSYLLAPVVSAIRDVALSSPEAASTLKLEDLIVYIAEHPPTTTIDSKLEETASVLLQSMDPSLVRFSYEYYFGERASYGFAALIDITNRLGNQDIALAENLLKRILEKWVKQRLPPPTVSQWKTCLQLQIMLLCAGQCLPRANETEAGKLLKDLYHILSVEPLPTLRYIIEWTIARAYIHHPSLGQTIFDELSTKDHHSNPKFLASLMKIGVTIAKTSTSDESFAMKLATVFVPLAASSKVVIRHEAQWQVPILLDHAREKQWRSITESTAFFALDDFIRSLERYSDPPVDRQIDQLDPISDHNLTHLVSGPWWDLDQVEQRKCQHSDFVRLLASSSPALPAPCLPLGYPPSSSDTSPATTNSTQEPADAVVNRVRRNVNTISSTLTSTPLPSSALQTKGTSYLATRDATRAISLLVIASLVDNPHNLGGLSRVSEIFGAGALYVTNPTVASSKDFVAVSVSSHFHLPILALQPDDIPSFVAEKRKEEGYTIVGIEQTDRSVLIGGDGKEVVALPEKCILVVGSEREGIPAKVLSECGMLVEIEQVGVTRSLNVQTAAGIVLAEYVRQRRAEKSERAM